MRQITAIVMLTLLCSCAPVAHLDMSRKYYSKPQPIELQGDRYGMRVEINLVNAVKTERLNEIIVRNEGSLPIAFNVDYKQHTDNIIAFLTEEFEKRNVFINNNSKKIIMLELASISIDSKKISFDSKWLPDVASKFAIIDLRVIIPEINFSKAYVKEIPGISNQSRLNVLSSSAIRLAVIDFLKEPELIKYLASTID